MCFARTELPQDLELYYDEHGSINEISPSEVYIPDGIHQHIDHPLLDEDDLEILAFIYENGNGMHIVYTSFEAELICSYCDNCETFHID